MLTRSHDLSALAGVYARASHEQQGHKGGDAGGGNERHRGSRFDTEGWPTNRLITSIVVFGSIWLLGAVTLIVLGKPTNQRRSEREQAMEALAKKQEFLMPSLTISVMG